MGRGNRTSGVPSLDYPSRPVRGAKPAGRPAAPSPRGGSSSVRIRRGTASVVQHVEPTDLTLWATVRHVYPLWRTQWRLVTVGLACALAFTGLSLLIPIIVQRTIDDAIDGGDSSLLVPYLTAIAVVATLRFGVNFTRRSPRRGSASGSRRACARCSTPRTSPIRAPSTTAMRRAR